VRNFLNNNVMSFEFTTKDVAAIFKRLRLSQTRVSSYYQVLQALYPSYARKDNSKEQLLL
jgi:hypothetical protein